MFRYRQKRKAYLPFLGFIASFVFCSVSMLFSSSLNLSFAEDESTGGKYPTLSGEQFNPVIPDVPTSNAGAALDYASAACPANAVGLFQALNSVVPGNASCSFPEKIECALFSGGKKPKDVEAELQASLKCIETNLGVLDTNANCISKMWADLQKMLNAELVMLKQMLATYRKEIAKFDEEAKIRETWLESAMELFGDDSEVTGIGGIRGAIEKLKAAKEQLPLKVDQIIEKHKDIVQQKEMKELTKKVRVMNATAKCFKDETSAEWGTCASAGVNQGEKIGSPLSILKCHLEADARGKPSDASKRDAHSQTAAKAKVSNVGAMLDQFLTKFPQSGAVPNSPEEFAKFTDQAQGFTTLDEVKSALSDFDGQLTIRDSNGKAIGSHSLRSVIDKMLTRCHQKASSKKDLVVKNLETAIGKAENQLKTETKTIYNQNIKMLGEALAASGRSARANPIKGCPGNNEASQVQCLENQMKKIDEKLDVEQIDYLELKGPNPAQNFKITPPCQGLNGCAAAFKNEIIPQLKKSKEYFAKKKIDKTNEARTKVNDYVGAIVNRTPNGVTSLIGDLKERLTGMAGFLGSKLGVKDAISLKLNPLDKSEQLEPKEEGQMYNDPTDMMALLNGQTGNSIPDVEAFVGELKGLIAGEKAGVSAKKEMLKGLGAKHKECVLEKHERRLSVLEEAKKLGSISCSHVDSWCGDSTKLQRLMEDVDLALGGDNGIDPDLAVQLSTGIQLACKPSRDRPTDDECANGVDGAAQEGCRQRQERYDENTMACGALFNGIEKSSRSIIRIEKLGGTAGAVE